MFAGAVRCCKNCEWFKVGKVQSTLTTDTCQLTNQLEKIKLLCSVWRQQSNFECQICSFVWQYLAMLKWSEIMVNIFKKVHLVYLVSQQPWPNTALHFAIKDCRWSFLVPNQTLFPFLSFRSFRSILRVVLVWLGKFRCTPSSLGRTLTFLSQWNLKLCKQ